MADLRTCESGAPLVLNLEIIDSKYMYNDNLNLISHVTFAIKSLGYWFMYLSDKEPQVMLK